jgi:outer membrane protein assembly factor BamD (BamD/ComL family)
MSHQHLKVVDAPRNVRSGGFGSRVGAWLAGLLIAAGAVSGVGCASTREFKFADIPRPFAKPKVEEPLVGPDGSLLPMKGLDEYEAAVAIYEKKDYPAAEKAFKAIAKKYKDQPIEEDALFMRGEAQFRQKHYAAADDSYQKLMVKYPSTRHLEHSTRRLFAIATIWLNPDGSMKSDKLMRISAEEVAEPKMSVSPEERSEWPLVPNLTDDTRPLFDTRGRALLSLKAIWQHDPLGELADDALVMTAAHYLRVGDYREADYYFGILREEYAKSEHAANAFVLGSHVKLMNYQGARYDGKILNDADNLVRSTLNLYPNVPQKERLTEELAHIREEAAKRDWAKVELYRRKSKLKAAALYCEVLIQDYPNSIYAEKARGYLAELDPKYRNGLLKEYPEHVAPKGKSYDDSPGRAVISDEEKLTQRGRN